MLETDVLYFLTIPKTASTTLYTIMASYFSDHEVAPVQPLHRLIGTPIGDIWRYRLVGGHYFYNVSPILGRCPVYVTMLRDPVDRALSYYAHIRRNPHHYAHMRLKCQSLSEFVRDERNLALFANLHVRHLGQNRNIPFIYKTFSRDALERGEFMEALEGYAPNGYDDRQMLELARTRVRNFLMVGIAERFDESLHLLCHRMNWDEPESYQRLMVNPTPFTQIDPDIREIIRAANALDYEFYDEMNDQFERQLTETDQIHSKRAR